MKDFWNLIGILALLALIWATVKGSRGGSLPVPQVSQDLSTNDIQIPEEPLYLFDTSILAQPITAPAPFGDDGEE